MRQVRYRFNRKTGKIYLDSESELTDIGDRLEMIILWASEPIWAKLFTHLPAQHWVQLTFVDRQGNWCYGLLNSGTSNALYPWLEYRMELEKSGKLYEFITTLSLEPAESEQEWFEYQFSGVRGKPGLEGRMRSLINSSPYSLIDLY